SGALNHTPQGQPPFRVAQIGICAGAAGQAVLHWQFSPPATRNRHTDIADVSGSLVQNSTLFTDYVFNVISGPGTPTNTPTSTFTNTPINTPTNTPTNSPTITPTNTPTATPPSCANYVITTGSAPIVPGSVDIGNHCDD